MNAPVVLKGRVLSAASELRLKCYRGDRYGCRGGVSGRCLIGADGVETYGTLRECALTRVYSRGVPSFVCARAATVTRESRPCLSRGFAASPCARLLLECCAHACGRVVNELSRCGDCVFPHLGAYDDCGYSSVAGVCIVSMSVASSMWGRLRLSMSVRHV